MPSRDELMERLKKLSLVEFEEVLFRPRHVKADPETQLEF
jgi:hypothetical protein